jgi:hypothetical protein
MTKNSVAPKDQANNVSKDQANKKAAASRMADELFKQLKLNK